MANSEVDRASQCSLVSIIKPNGLGGRLPCRE